MKAILVNDDRSLRWDNVPDPVISPEEVLVKIEYAALNRADLMQREGDYPPPAGCPEWMGLEISGEIVEIGKEASEKSNWKLGDKVCALLGGGGYAEYVSDTGETVAANAKALLSAGSSATAGSLELAANPAGVVLTGKATITATTAAFAQGKTIDAFIFCAVD